MFWNLQPWPLASQLTILTFTLFTESFSTLSLVTWYFNLTSTSTGAERVVGTGLTMHEGKEWKQLCRVRVGMEMSYSVSKSHWRKTSRQLYFFLLLSFKIIIFVEAPLTEISFLKSFPINGEIKNR